MIRSMSANIYLGGVAIWRQDVRLPDFPAGMNWEILDQGFWPSNISSSKCGNSGARKESILYWFASRFSMGDVLGWEAACLLGASASLVNYPLLRIYSSSISTHMVLVDRRQKVACELGLRWGLSTANGSGFRSHLHAWDVGIEGVTGARTLALALS